MPVAVHIIEDDPAVRDAALELVASGGRRVFAYDGPSAFFAAPPPNAKDIIVLDIHFPGSSGIEVADKLRRRHPNIKIVVISGVRGRSFERALAAIAPAASFRKPLDGSAFADCVNRLAST
jgi:FixJ family two-component response regulator